MKTRSLWTVVALLALLFLLVLPVGAQTEPGQSPQATAAGQPEADSPSILSLTLGELIGILFGVGSLMVGVGKILWDANQNPGGASIDTRLTQQVATAHGDREWIERLEKAYQFGGLQNTRAIDALAGVLANIAPLTGLKVDDAVLNLLQDIQKPGAEPPLYDAQTPG